MSVLSRAQRYFGRETMKLVNRRIDDIVASIRRDRQKSEPLDEENVSFLCPKCKEAGVDVTIPVAYPPPEKITCPKCHAAYKKNIRYEITFLELRPTETICRSTYEIFSWVLNSQRFSTKVLYAHNFVSLIPKVILGET